MKKIYLYNRYRANLWLECIDKDLWTLNASNKDDLAYMRIIYKEDNKGIEAIDPSGGPFLSVGSTVEGYKIEEIFSNGYVLRLKECD